MDGQPSSPVVFKSGARGTLLSPPGDPSAQALVELEDGRRVLLPAELLVRRPDGTCSVEWEPSTTADPLPSEPPTQPAVVVPVIQEELVVGKRTVTTGGARITKRVREDERIIDEELMREEVAIEHVPIGKPWEGPPPPTRYEGDTLIIPLLEEVIVVEKRLMLKEELRVSRVKKTAHEPQRVTVRREDVTVERIEAELPQSEHTPRA